MRCWLALLACAVVWTDTFPVTVWRQQFGPGVMEEVKVEVCGSYVTVSKRLYREFSEGRKMVEKEIRPWSTRASYWITSERSEQDPPAVQAVP